jgi:phage terminase large subunit
VPTRQLVHTYAPRNNCAKLWSYRGPEVILSGPAGTGKSRACLEKLHAMMLATPGARGLIVRKTAESLTSTALVTFREWVLPEALEAGIVEFYGGSAEEPAQYRYENGSRVMLGGMNKPTKIMSSEYDVIYVQEAIELTETDWQALLTRLRNGRISFQQIIADTNPELPTHWLQTRATAGRLRMWESRHVDNPRYYDEVTDQPASPDDEEHEGRRYRLTEAGAQYIRGILDSLTGVRYQRLRLGLWVAAEDITFKEYDPATHLIDQFPIPEDWPRAWSVDFGFRHPFVCTMWATAPDGELYCYRQHMGTGRTVQDWAERILASVRVHEDGPAEDMEWPPPDPNAPLHSELAATVVRHGRAVPRETPAARTACTDTEHWHDPTAQHHYRWTEPEPEVILTDHQAEDRATLERYLGLPTQPADKRVNLGRDRVEQRFKERRLFIMRGGLVERDPALTDASRPACLEEEIPGYQWDPKKDKPIKIMDDACDTMRYVVAHHDLGASELRFL